MLEFKYKQNLTEQNLIEQEKIKNAFEIFSDREDWIHKTYSNLIIFNPKDFIKSTVKNYNNLRKIIDAIVSTGHFYNEGVLYLQRALIIDIEEYFYQEGALFDTSVQDHLRLARAFFIAEVIK